MVDWPGEMIHSPGKHGWSRQCCGCVCAGREAGKRARSTQGCSTQRATETQAIILPEFSLR
jgi:hypothetical protein